MRCLIGAPVLDKVIAYHHQSTRRRFPRLLTAGKVTVCPGSGCFWALLVLEPDSQSGIGLQVPEESLEFDPTRLSGIGHVLAELFNSMLNVAPTLS